MWWCPQYAPEDVRGALLVPPPPPTPSACYPVVAQLLKRNVLELEASGDEADARQLRTGVSELLWRMTRMQVDAGVGHGVALAP